MVLAVAASLCSSPCGHPAITFAYVAGRAGGLEVGGVVPASTFVLESLSVAAGEGFVLHRAGEPVDWQCFGHFWRKTRKAAGLDSIRYHDLRHAYASMLISAGCSVKAVSSALGHSTAATTLNLYSHLWPGDEDRIRQAVDLALGRAEDSVRTDGATG